MGKLIRSLPRLVWPVVLGVVLAVSAYSMFYIFRHWGVPVLFAAAMSTVYDGSAIVFADLSLRYIEKDMSGSGPRMAVRLCVGLSAWLNAQHAIIGHESLAALCGWAGLPLIAAAIFEFYTRFERRVALAKNGRAYPRPMPSWGAATWLLFLPSTLDLARDLLRERRDALARANKLFFAEDMGLKPARPAIQPAADKGHADKRAVSASQPAANSAEPAAEIAPEPTTNSDNREVPGNHGQSLNAEVIAMPTGTARAPKEDIRAWWKETGREPKLGNRGRIPAHIEEAYRATHAVGEEACGGQA